MQDLHWRWNFNTAEFDFVEHNPQQHYEPLLKLVHVATLVIDINLVALHDLALYIQTVLHRAHAQRIHFQQIIFDGTQDPVQHYAAKARMLDQFAARQGIASYFAVSQFELTEHQYLVEINYPSWLFVFKRQQFAPWTLRERTHAFSCLNRNPSLHRLVLYTKIKQQGLLPEFIYSFLDRCPYQGHAVTAHRYPGLAHMVGAHTAALCLENIQDFPLAWNQEVLGQNDHSISHAAYHDTWCNVVTETSAAISFTSEKIWKPIAAGQLFLVAGAANTTAWLRQLGFHTFEDHHDSSADLNTRLDTVVSVIDQHRHTARDWWHENRFHIEHNYHWFHSGNVEQSLVDPIVALLNHK